MEVLQCLHHPTFSRNMVGGGVILLVDLVVQVVEEEVVSVFNLVLLEQVISFPGHSWNYATATGGGTGGRVLVVNPSPGGGGGGDLVVLMETHIEMHLVVDLVF